MTEQFVETPYAQLKRLNGDVKNLQDQLDHMIYKTNPHIDLTENLQVFREASVKLLSKIDQLIARIP